MAKIHNYHLHNNSDDESYNNEEDDLIFNTFDNYLTFIEKINNGSDPDDKNYKLEGLELLQKIYENNKKKTNIEIQKKFKEEIKKIQLELENLNNNLSEDLNTKNTLVKKIIDYSEINNILVMNIQLYKEDFNYIKFIKYEKNKLDNPPEVDGDKFELIVIPSKKRNIQQTETNFNKKQKKQIDSEFQNLYEEESNILSVIKYYNMLELPEKKKYLEKLKEIKKSYNIYENGKPNYIKILETDTTIHNKLVILQKINIFDNSKGASESTKLRNWINRVISIPFGIYISPPINKNDNLLKIKNYLKSARDILDETVYGHSTTKDQLIRILAHTITNPEEGGNIFALQGPPGVGKTALIQDGISKAIGRPFTFISLGGATDSCFLEGHDYTYEGSNHGRIVEILQKAKCMNPVIYFDELDKVSETRKGDEIINILMHITDSTQNSHFNDKYFGSIDFDLSKALIIFSFNDEHKISRILRDRMKIIRVKGYKIDEKIKIASDYILPKLYKEIGLSNTDVEFSENIINHIIENYTNEGGVRKLKENLKDILLEINLRKLEGSKINNKKIKNKILITEEILSNDLFKNKRKLECIKINSEPKVGIVNGLWANDLGIGGLIPIECCWIPSTDKLELELTGMQGKVMKESMSVARTIAWRILPEYIKEQINTKWRNSFDYGIHIHCPDGATPKDGPSAGGAITTCLISLLTDNIVNNKIAMTGEINLKGKITAIGGLEEKLFGAKKAGVELVLCPNENEHDLKEILVKFPYLVEENFNIKMVSNIWEILDIVLINKIDYIRFD